MQIGLKLSITNKNKPLTRLKNSALLSLMAEYSNNGYGKKPIWQWVVIYLILAAIVYGVVYYFFFAKNSGYNYNQSSNQYETVQPTTAANPTDAMMASEMTVTLTTENNSSQSGTAILKEEAGKTTVTLALTGFVEGVPQPAHIHVGSCPGVGAVKYPLTNVVDGTSTTVLAMTLADLRKELPLAINVHKSAKEVAVYTACGELK